MNDSIQLQLRSAAIDDLRELIRPIAHVVAKVWMIGSITRDVDGQIGDVDFLVSCHELEFEKVRSQLETAKRIAGITRSMQVQPASNGYSNCPDWPKTDPPMIHILLHRQGESLTNKLRNWQESAIDVTNQVC